MKVLNFSRHEYLKLLAEKLNKPLLYLSYVPVDDAFHVDDIKRDVPFYNDDILQDLLMEQVTIIACENEEELNDLFYQVRGDETPNGTVFALTVSAEGELLNENT